MNALKNPFPMRVFFLVLSSLLWLGIWLGGFSFTHWVIYVPASTLLFAAITGFCPGLITSSYLFGHRSSRTNVKHL